ncbi:MAG TPA: T9SS type A sorting domain-containing protein [Chitinophagales bacterium]|nr:T9SS type A sorting domain-containing protein [Chitinophagales bacterium]
MNYIKAWIVVIICAFVFVTKTKAQIAIPNRELEGNPCLARAGGNIDTFELLDYCPLPGFFQCDSFIAVMDSFTNNNPTNVYPSLPHSGRTCLVISDISNTLKGTVSAMLSCPLKKKKEYFFSYWASSWFYFYETPKIQTLTIWGNIDTCVRIERIWESEHIDTGWHQYTAILTPKLQDYEYIHFRIGVMDSESRCILLDSLSDIYPFNGNDVTATIQDTAFAKANSTCIELSATANITTYDTVYWQDAAGNKIADGFNGGTVCPDSSTYYVIAMRDSVQDCAGIWWSYDTVKVTVNTGTAVATPAGSEAYGVNIFPNPATNSINIKSGANPMRQISICDINGKVLFMQSTSQKTQTQIILEGIVQTQGVYIAEVTFTNGLKQRIKFLKQ